jgi:hypothetical protein
MRVRSTLLARAVPATNTPIAILLEEEEKKKSNGKLVNSAYVQSL